MQQLLLLQKPKVKYVSGPYNKFNSEEQWIRITDGCPNNCPYCYAPNKNEYYGIPEIVRNKVSILDMNLLSFLNALDILKELASKKVNGKPIYYELICGIDYRFLTKEIAEVLFNGRFGDFNKKRSWKKRIRIAWDWQYSRQNHIRKAIDLLSQFYSRKQIMVFMIGNWAISYEECCKKLDLLKVWNVMVADCWYDNQKRGKVMPIFWKKEEIKSFSEKCRKHNQLITWRIDPEIKRVKDEEKNNKIVYSEDKFRI